MRDCTNSILMKIYIYECAAFFIERKDTHDKLTAVMKKKMKVIVYYFKRGEVNPKFQEKSKKFFCIFIDFRNLTNM